MLSHLEIRNVGFTYDMGDGMLEISGFENSLEPG